MLKLFPVFSALAFILAFAPARADMCRSPNGGVEPCGEIPSSWTQCGTFQEQAVWCYPSGKTGGGAGKSKSDLTNTLIYVGIGVVFVGAMWYFFGMPRSSNEPTQVKLMEF
jgi:hypothetical protein